MIQETDDIKRMIRWAVDTDGVRFAKQIYNREEPDEYTRDKFTSNNWTTSERSEVLQIGKDEFYYPKLHLL